MGAVSIVALMPWAVTMLNIEEIAYWQELARIVGWRLYGWTSKSHATYIDSKNKTIQLTSSQRDDIVLAVRKAQGLR